MNALIGISNPLLPQASSLFPTTLPLQQESFSIAQVRQILDQQRILDMISAGLTPASASHPLIPNDGDNTLPLVQHHPLQSLQQSAQAALGYFRRTGDISQLAELQNIVQKQHGWEKGEDA